MAPSLRRLVNGDSNSTSVYNNSKTQLIPWLKKPHTAITNQPEES